MNIHSVWRVLFRVFRKKRMSDFVRMFGIDSGTRVLDVGGDLDTWTGMPVLPRITMLNITVERVAHAGTFSVVGDGRCLPFKDGAFDVVFCNSVIEHLGNGHAQEKFAAEIRRVARSYYVQTPNRRFFVEPHLLTPFIHFLRVDWQRRMLRNFTLWGLITRPTRERCDEFLEEVCLLSEKEMRVLFPDAAILKEKVTGVTKSFMAVKLPPQVGIGAN